MTNDLSRRKFLEKVGLGAATGAGAWLLKDVAHAEPPAASLPSRTLGRSGAKVSILAFGCGSRFLMYEDEQKAQAALNHAIDLGITYLDTAYAYGDGKSETSRGPSDGLAPQGYMARYQDSRSHPRRIHAPPRSQPETTADRSCGPSAHSQSRPGKRPRKD